MTKSEPTNKVNSQFNNDGSDTMLVHSQYLSTPRTKRTPVDLYRRIILKQMLKIFVCGCADSPVPVQTNYRKSVKKLINIFGP